MDQVSIIFPIKSQDLHSARLRASFSKLKLLLGTECKELEIEDASKKPLVVSLTLCEHGSERRSQIAALLEDENRYGKSPFLLFQFPLPEVDDSYFEDDVFGEFDEKRRITHWLLINAEHVSTRLRDFCISLNLSFPGTVTLAEPFLIFRGEVRAFYSQELFSWLSLHIDTCHELGLNALRELDPSFVWKWFSRQPGILSGVSDSSVSRACSIFTHLFHDTMTTDEIADFVWSISGVEALLSDGRGSYAAQIVGKLQALGVIDPGSIEIISSQFKKIYSLRSKCVHGSRELKNKFIDNIQDDDDRRRYDELREATAVCCYVLIFLLQFAALNAIDRIDFRFSYVGGLARA